MLQYDILHSGLSGTLRKDGNIAQTIWRVRGRQRQAYSYSYDGLQRISAATYSDINDAGTVTASNRYNTTYTYADLRGNISNLQRNGLYLSGGCYTQALMDNLTYTHTSGTNKISSITDAAMSAQGGFRAASGGYTYDANGNMLTNGAKGITSISYNHLNLPTNITITGGKTIDFTYAADGTKLHKVVKTGATINLVMEYVNGIEYRGTAIPATTLEAVYFAEGRLYNNSGFWKREYVIKDHLGNTRIAYCDINGDGVIAVPGEILQENNYDAFGNGSEGVYMNHANADNQYQYNGKELNGDHGLNMYDYGARWYDVGIARFTTVDPISSKMSGWSTYAYGFNNPIRFIDPTGMAPDDWVRGANGSIRWDASANSQATTKQGDTYLGKELSLTFNSYIDAKSWDGPNSKAPDDKLTSTITITGNENSNGELTSLSSSKTVEVGSTPIGTARDYYPGEGGSNNNFELKSTATGASLNFEQHASVSKVEEIGMKALGYKIVDVAQKLNVDYNKKSGELSISASTGLFPSATLSVNGTRVMNYNQPSFVNTHTAPIVGTSSPSSGSIPIRDFSYYPTKFYKQ